MTTDNEKPSEEEIKKMLEDDDFRFLVNIQENLNKTFGGLLDMIFSLSKEVEKLKKEKEND